MGHRETSALAFVEWPLGYHPCDIGILTCAFESRRGTLLGGQFDWGGRSERVTEAFKGSLSLNGNQAKECKRRSEPNCETDGSSSNEVGVSDPVVCEWKCHRSTDKSYPGDNRLISPKSPHRREVWHLDVGSSHPGAEFGPKGLAVRQLKRYASWVQNVVRQFGPYLSWAQDI